MSILDTCYDFRNYATIDVPTVSFFFNGGVEASLVATGIVYIFDASEVCLVFASNKDETDVTIFGNVQQRTVEVVYDGARERVGFVPKGCI
ncbi:hypothetical protein Pint_12546 [Pistacia integerrima]|uniref:Uncharacterized protein n=1 Tax=Pistacia integerrima TaxID=434235 RepID=A0ACC0Y5T0_9ROSI|nr:hypothetical protein Pint_12546 [Pistacia integerrima]